MDIPSLLIGLVIGLAVGVIAVLVYYTKGFSKKQKAIQDADKKSHEDAELLLANAEKNGESRKRELLLQAKEEIHKARVELERDVRERQSELGRERNRIDQKESNLDRKLEQVSQQQSNLDKSQNLLDEKIRRAEEIEEQKVIELEQISGLSVSEARELVLQSAEQTYRHDLAVLFSQIEEEYKQNAEQRAKDVVVTSIQRYASDYVSDNTVSVVTLPSDEMKGRIIGREGRNIRAFETATGVDMIIDDTPEAVILSCFNPIRREIARLALEKLVQDGRIHPASIETMVEKAKREVDQTIRAEGERAVLESGVLGVPSELVNLLGRMRYRTSYGQNALKHSLEVCDLSGLMAAELGLDVQLAKRAGLLHDIGKSCDFEFEGSHIDLGIEMAKKYKEDETVINSIASHHGDVEPTSPISVLVAAADALSAARPGARRENIETYVKRIQALEEIANSFEGVEKSYAIQAGRELRVIVEPEKISDAEMELKAFEICKRIEEELNYPGQIKVNMIRETRFSGLAR